MSKAGPGMSPNKEAQTQRVSPTGPKKIFVKGGISAARAPRAPSRSPGQASNADRVKKV